MIGSLIRMVAGRAVARQVGGVSAGPLGMAAGAALPFVLVFFARLSPPSAVAAVDRSTRVSGKSLTQGGPWTGLAVHAGRQEKPCAHLH